MKATVYFVILILLLTSCSPKKEHFISDGDYREMIKAQFDSTKVMAASRSEQLFDVFNQNLSIPEAEALQFLYASMPLSDLADYDGDYFLKIVRTTLEGKSYFTWADDIPENVFRHFVLPYRINNENLDSARWVFYKEIKDRVIDLSMHDAALEVNHWCHERVTYRGTDIRTSSPLSTIRTGFGRCGEESTLLVAALRSVCIPARQVYVPRWAHSDDNHAWVEVWVDGEWHYLGGCEPSAQMDQGWFTEPARRAMLVHTKAFGSYSGPEEILHKKARYSELNVLGNYADVKKVSVRVFDSSNQAIANAKVEFGLYNYAEFYPLYKSQTNENGYCSFTTGKGDLVISASKGMEFGFYRFDTRLTDTCKVILTHLHGDEFKKRLHLRPPAKPEALVVDTTGKVLCFVKMGENDARRKESIKQQFNHEKAAALFKQRGWPEGGERWNYLIKSKGNFESVYKLLELDDPYTPLLLLRNISDKDLRDVPYEILYDHIFQSNFIISDLPNPETYGKYLISPRVKNEKLTAYRSFLIEKFGHDFWWEYKNNPQLLIDWIQEHIKLDVKNQYYDLPITPVGVYELRIANEDSRNIFFVAASRTFGIPARLEPGLLHPQIDYNGKWMDVDFEKGLIDSGSFVHLVQTKEMAFTPEYHIHFAIAGVKDGLFLSLEYEYGKKWNEFPEFLPVKPGYYRFLNSNRLADESILVDLLFKEIKADSVFKYDISLPEQQIALEVVGEFPLDYKLVKSHGRTNLVTSNLLKKEGTIFAFFKPGEPAQHLLAELHQSAEAVKKWKGQVALITPASYIHSEPLDVRVSPDNIAYYHVPDPDFNEIIVQYKETDHSDNYPYVFVVNKEGKILYYSEGYQIGLVEKMLKVLSVK